MATKLFTEAEFWSRWDVPSNNMQECIASGFMTWKNRTGSADVYHSVTLDPLVTTETCPDGATMYRKGGIYWASVPCSDSHTPITRPVEIISIYLSRGIGALPDFIGCASTGSLILRIAVHMARLGECSQRTASGSNTSTRTWASKM